MPIWSAQKTTVQTTATFKNDCFAIRPKNSCFQETLYQISNLLQSFGSKKREKIFFSQLRNYLVQYIAHALPCTMKSVRKYFNGVMPLRSWLFVASI